MKTRRNLGVLDPAAVLQASAPNRRQPLHTVHSR